MHAVGFGEVHRVVCVFNGFEARELLALFRLGDASPDDAAGYDLVETLQKDVAILFLSVL